MIGIVILVGYYIDVFNMVMFVIVGKFWYIGIFEIGLLFFFFGLFVLVVFIVLIKVLLLVK